MAFENENPAIATTAAGLAALAAKGAPGRTITAEQVIEHSRGLIAHYKCPRRVEIRETSLPLSGAGKVLKSQLREPFWAGRDKRVS